MKSHKFFLIVLTAVLFFHSFQSNVFAKDEWVRVQSKNFSLIGNAGDKEIRRVATKLEQFRDVFTKLFPKMKFTSPIPTTVIVFKSGKAFKPYKPINASGKATDWVAGYFQGSEDVNYIVLSTEGESQQTYSTIFHEYVHYLVNNNLGRGKVPPWFNEGIAEFYEQFSIENDQKVTLGGLNERHLYSLQQSQIIPFDTYFNIDYRSLHQQGNHGANIFYAQSWALMHYLMLGNERKRQPQMTKFLGLVMDGKQPRDAFQEAFQTDYATMEKELKNYVKQRLYTVLNYNSGQKMVYDSVMQTAPMSEAEAKAYLGDLLLHSRRMPEAEAHFNEALALEPDSALANASLGMLKMQEQKYDEAKRFVEKAVAKDNNNFRIYYGYAYILSREGTGENVVHSGYSDDSYEKMRLMLLKAMTLNPDYAESYRLLAYINMVKDANIDEGIQAMTKALSLAPGNQYYQMNLSDLYLRKQDFDKALAIIENVAQTADEPQLRAHAERSLASLRNYKQQIENAKKNGYVTDTNGASGAPRLIVRRADDKPPTEEELEKLREQAQNDAINSNLRKPEATEKRVIGYLSAIDCKGGITFTVKVDGKPLKFESKDFQNLHLMAFVQADDMEFGCNSIKKDYYAIITYLPNNDPKAKTLGQMVAIELVAESFKLREETAK